MKTNLPWWPARATCQINGCACCACNAGLGSLARVRQSEGIGSRSGMDGIGLLALLVLRLLVPSASVAATWTRTTWRERAQFWIGDRYISYGGIITLSSSSRGGSVFAVCEWLDGFGSWLARVLEPFFSRALSLRCMFPLPLPGRKRAFSRQGVLPKQPAMPEVS